MDKLLRRWPNLGWDPTVVKQNHATTIVYVDMKVDKETDPTCLPGVIELLIN